MLALIYSPSKFVFIHIPRTGGMAITQALAGRLPEIADMTINNSGIGDQHWWRHSRACELARDIPHWDALYRFAVIRNPWEIIGSFWTLVQRDLMLLDRPCPAFSRSAADYWAFLSQSARMTFEDCVRWHFEYLRPSGGFWRYWCCGERGEDLGVEAVRFERLVEEWPRVCRRMGFDSPPTLGHVNGVDRECRNCDAEAIELIARLCPNDVERFGYDPPTASRSAVNDCQADFHPLGHTC